MEEEEIKGMLKKKQGKDKEFEQALEQNDELGSMDFHKVSVADILKRFDTNESNGLTDEQTNKKIAEVGLNKLEEKKQLHWIVKLLLEMTGIFSILLWIGAILCFIGYGIQSSNKDEEPDISNV